MNKTINIYLDSQYRKQVESLKVKYRLSLTTIVDVITKITFKYFLWSKEDINNATRLYDEYLYPKGKKTSIKEPKLYKENPYINGTSWHKENRKSRFTTNCLMIYLKKEIKNYIKQEDVEKYYNDINKELTTRKDEFWNYNEHIRMQRRMLRENKEYFRKALDENK